MSATLRFQPGSLVSVRGRDWIVLPGSTDELLLIRPIEGTDEESTGILTAMEDVAPTSFATPTPDQIGDNRSCGFLRDAMRLGLRNGAGPFRSFGRIAVDPRPYQLVPLMLAMKQDPVRLLIADDVGVGKTVEAALIVRELIDRGECRRFSVLCPPYLAEQWVQELYEKFHLDAKLVLPSTIRRLERECGSSESVFEVFPYTVVSIDFIKSDRYRAEFLRTAPELIVFDEAHSISYAPGYTSARHQRHLLAEALCKEKDRHVIFVTATPHSGKENAFRSLLGLLNPSFLDFPEDLAGDENLKYRRQIANHLVQRRRGDILHYLDRDTVFPDRKVKDEPWTLSPEYKTLFEKVIDFTRGMVDDATGGQRMQRVRWWSALSLLRALASSPAAARETLINRNRALELEADDVEHLGNRLVLDLDLDDEEDTGIPMGADCESDDEAASPVSDTRRRKLLEFAKEAETLCGDKDAKMLTLAAHVKKLVKEGFAPIVFCRFIPTVGYLCDQLRARLPKNFEIAGVSGLLPPEERERRITELTQKENRVLICTDCLSEGINLQEAFNAVVHYDLSWNPTRHEQREGRVDRFGQSSPTVRMVTLYGSDNYIDGIVLNILIKKHRNIKNELGISVPVPTNTKEVFEAIFAGLLLKRGSKPVSRAYATHLLPGMDEYLSESAVREQEKLNSEWEDAKEREKRSRTMFAQEAYANRVDEIRQVLDETRDSIGSEETVERFVRDVLSAEGAMITPESGGYRIDLSETPESLRDYLPDYDIWNVRFSLPVPEGYEYVSRTHPLTEKLAEFVKNNALDPESENPLARRCGVIRTGDVKTRTTLLLLRQRFHILQSKRGEEPRPILAEEVQIVGFAGSPSAPEWLTDEQVKSTLRAQPSGNVPIETARRRIQDVLDRRDSLQDAINTFARQRADALKEAHTKVRFALRESQKTEVRPELPVDLVGIYVYLP